MYDLVQYCKTQKSLEETKVSVPIKRMMPNMPNKGDIKF